MEDGQRHWKTEKALEDGQRYWRMDRGIGGWTGVLGTLKNGNRSWRKERGVGERKEGLEEE